MHRKGRDTRYRAHLHTSENTLCAVGSGEYPSRPDERSSAEVCAVLGLQGDEESILPLTHRQTCGVDVQAMQNKPCVACK